MKLARLSSSPRDFWFWTTLGIAALFLVFLVYPLFSLFASSFVDPETGGFTLAHYAQFFKKRYYYRALLNSMSVTACVTVLAVLIGAPMAYLTSAFQIRGKRFVDVLIIISMLSPPFIGAYSWILLGGRSGVITTFVSEYLGMKMPTIYGFTGILLVLTLKLYPFVYLYVSGALKSIDVSLSEAAESLGCDPIKKVFTIILPLVTPTVLAGGLLVFMNALADFGTPMLIGEGFVVMPVLIYSEFVSEMGGEANFAAALAALMVVLTCLIFLGQKYVVNKKSFTMSALRPMKPNTLAPVPSAFAHLFIYLLVFLSIIPQLTVIYTSFMKVNGVVFTSGYSLDSYRIIFDKLGTAITNTYVYGLAAIVIIVLLGMFIAYLATRRRNLITSLIDTFTMFPYIIPGSVLGITLLLAFNKPPIV
jgi:iron(III) transport system permease protein